MGRHESKIATKSSIPPRGDFFSFKTPPAFRTSGSINLKNLSIDESILFIWQ